MLERNKDDGTKRPVGGLSGGERSLRVTGPEIRTSLVQAEENEKRQDGILPKGLEGNEAGHLIMRPHRYLDRTHQGPEMYGKIDFKGPTEFCGTLGGHNRQKSKTLSHRFSLCYKVHCAHLALEKSKRINYGHYWAVIMSQESK